MGPLPPRASRRHSQFNSVHRRRTTWRRTPPTPPRAPAPRPVSTSKLTLCSGTGVTFPDRKLNIKISTAKQK